MRLTGAATFVDTLLSSACEWGILIPGNLRRHRDPDHLWYPTHQGRRRQQPRLWLDLDAPLGSILRSAVNGDIPVFGGVGTEGASTIVSDQGLNSDGCV